MSSFNSIGVTPIDPGALLKLLQAQLQQSGIPNGSNIPGAGLGDLAFLSMWPEELHLKNPRGRQFVAIKPGRYPLWQSVLTGSGTPFGPGNVSGDFLTTPGFNSITTLTCYAQINADVEMRSTQALVEDTLGVIAFVLKVMTAVQFWFPTDGDGNSYLREPARITDGGFGLNGKKAGDAYWVSANLELETRFTAAFPTL